MQEIVAGEYLNTTASTIGIATDLPQFHILQFTEGYGVANNLTGYQVNLWGSLTWNVQKWQLQ